MNQTDQITDWTGLRLDVQAVELRQGQNIYCAAC